MQPQGPDPNAIDGLVSARSAARLRAFRRGVERAFPGRLQTVLLFGSRARGESRRDSDYDVAVILTNDESAAETRRILSDLAFPHVRAGTPIRPLALLARDMGEASALPIARSISRDGVVIA